MSVFFRRPDLIFRKPSRLKTKQQPKILLELITNSVKLKGNKINIQKSVVTRNYPKKFKRTILFAFFKQETKILGVNATKVVKGLSMNTVTH
jgi:hypothetical protein